MTLVAAGPLASFALLAANDWTELLVPLVVFIVWVINHLIAAGKRAGAPKKPGGPQPIAGERAQGNRPGQGGLVDEVDRFLQEARKSMQKQQKPAARPAPSKPQSRGKSSNKSSQSRKPQPPPRQSLADRSTLKPQLADSNLEVRDLGGTLAQHVQQHLDTSSFDVRAGKLSQLRQEVDRDVDLQVNRMFDHQVGALGGAKDVSSTAPQAAVDPASQLLMMLSDPSNLRSAIILQEILTPPTERW